MAENVETIKGTSLGRDAWKRLLKNKLAVFGLIVLGIMLAVVIVGPSLVSALLGVTADGMPADGQLLNSFPPSWSHPMGTDEAGRDVFARVLQGGRISLMVAIISTIVSLIVGVSYGATAGYLGGSIDNIMMRIVDIIYAIPYILIVIVLLSVFGGPNTSFLIGLLPVIVTMVVTLILLFAAAISIYRLVFGMLERSIPYWANALLKVAFCLLAIAAVVGVVMLDMAMHRAFLSTFGAWIAEKYAGSVNQGLSQIFLLFFALGLVSWLTMARVVRGQILSLKNQEFVLAAKATGVSTFKIIFRHLVPNALGPVIVYATLTVPSVMLTEAFLSFLGLGVQAPYASWGSLCADGIKNIGIFPWQLVFPGVTMALTLFSLNFLGDGLRDALDSPNPQILIDFEKMSNHNGTILSVNDLKTYFQTEDGVVKAVDGITFTLEKGETLGIVGESGSGKSVTNLSVMGLIPEPPGKIVNGDIIFDGIDVRALSIDEIRKIRGKRIAMIFQDPMTSLNPFLKISTQLMEVTRLHLGHSKKQAREHALKMLKMVGIPDAEGRLDNYPHEFSGGMRQRVMIAMALSCDPELLIADEPTTALDVTIQAQILELIKDLKDRMGTSVILITHDLGVVAGMTEKIIVMYAGKVFEQAPTKELFATPANPYTKGLLKSVPDPAHEQGVELYQIPGLPPDVAHLPPGCPFAERCDRAQDICREQYPPFVQINENHHSLCHFAKEVYAESVQEKETK